jgi:macrodomain Ter protein organizer (MatP/YcbG family)
MRKTVQLESEVWAKVNTLRRKDETFSEAIERVILITEKLGTLQGTIEELVRGGKV